MIVVCHFQKLLSGEAFYHFVNLVFKESNASLMHPTLNSRKFIQYRIFKHPPRRGDDDETIAIQR